MSDGEIFGALFIALVLICMGIAAIGVVATCSDVSDLKRSVCALNYHAATTASDSLGVQRSSGCPLPSTTKAGQ